MISQKALGHGVALDMLAGHRVNGLIEHRRLELHILEKLYQSGVLSGKRGRDGNAEMRDQEIGGARCALAAYHEIPACLLERRHRDFVELVLGHQRSEEHTSELQSLMR